MVLALVLSYLGVCGDCPGCYFDFLCLMAVGDWAIGLLFGLLSGAMSSFGFPITILGFCPQSPFFRFLMAIGLVFGTGTATRPIVGPILGVKN